MTYFMVLQPFDDVRLFTILLVQLPSLLQLDRITSFEDIVMCFYVVVEWVCHRHHPCRQVVLVVILTHLTESLLTLVGYRTKFKVNRRDKNVVTSRIDLDSCWTNIDHPPSISGLRIRDSDWCVGAQNK